MMHVIEQTREEKIAMYLKLTKRELAGMLINANDAIRLMAPQRSVTSVPLQIDPTPYRGTTWFAGLLPKT